MNDHTTSGGLESSPTPTIEQPDEELDDKELDDEGGQGGGTLPSLVLLALLTTGVALAMVAWRRRGNQ